MFNDTGDLWIMWKTSFAAALAVTVLAACGEKPAEKASAPAPQAAPAAAPVAAPATAAAPAPATTAAAPAPAAGEEKKEGAEAKPAGEKKD
jgi:general secretion pathway protein B